MSQLRVFLARIRGIGRLTHADRDCGDEIASHLAEAEEEYLARGLTPADAHRAARRDFGGITQARETSHDARRFAAAEDAILDLRFAVRLLRRDRWFTTAVLLTVAVSVAGAASVYATTYGVLLRPLPYAQPQELVRLWELHPGARAPLTGEFLSFPTYDGWSRDARSVESIGAFNVRDATVSVGGLARRWRGAEVTPSVFAVLRTSPQVGRLLSETDAGKGAPPVLILTHQAWLEEFDGQDSTVGRTVTVNGTDHRIVGITPAGFDFPGHDSSWIDAPRPIAFYTVLAAHRYASASAVSLVSAIARLTPEATLPQVEVEGTGHARSVSRPSAELAFGPGGAVEVRAERLSSHTTKALRPAILVASAAIGLVLIIAWANVANLCLVRATTRARELALRAAIGANRSRLVRQLLTEGVLLSMVGGGLGAATGWILLRALPTIAPPGMAAVLDLNGSLPFLTAATVITVAVGLITGLVPLAAVTHAARTGLTRASQPTGAAGGRMRRVLLGLQAALAVILIIGTALLGRSFVNLVRVNPGYDATHVFTAEVYGAAAATSSLSATNETLRSILERIRGVPGVVAAGAGNLLPFSGVLSSVGFVLPGLTHRDGSSIKAQAILVVVTAGYAEALGMTLLKGRFLQPQDVDRGTYSLLVSRAFERAYLSEGAEPVVGRQFVGLFPRVLEKRDAVFEIVGVVDDVLLAPNDAPRPQLYVSSGKEFGGGSNTLAVRTTGEPAAVAATVRRIVQEEAPGATLDRVSALTDKLSASMAQPRFAAFVITGFSLVAVTLAAVGLYAVASYHVERRRAEIALRLALGATPRAVVVRVMRVGLGPTALGLVVGLLLAGLGSRLLQGLLFGVAPMDPVAFASGPILLLFVACLACAVPAVRATRIPPMRALHVD